MNGIPVVEYGEDSAILVGNFLRKQGYDICDSIGCRRAFLEASDEVGILFQDPEEKPTSFLWGLISYPSSRSHIATIWFDNGTRDAHALQWVIEVFGRKHVPRVRKLSEELAKKFDVGISVSLDCEEVRKERTF